jgi:hypothetical protein
MPMTLLEASKINKGDVVRNTVIEMFAASTPLMQAMQWMDIPGGSYHYNQEGQLPGVAFRGINQSYDESTGILNPQTEVLRIVGGDLDVDKALVKMHGPAVRAQHEALKVKALGLYLSKKLIKGDSLADPREFDGLRNRITGSQLIPVKAISPTNGGDPLSLLALDEAIDAVDEPTHLIMSKAMRRILTAAARDVDVGGFITYDVDAFGRRVTQYNDLPIIELDYDDLGQRIIAFDEVGATGANTTATSIYCVSIREGMLMGLQNGIPDVADLGEVDDKPVLRTRLEWLAGFATLHGRCASRLYGISNAPAGV